MTETKSSEVKNTGTSDLSTSTVDHTSVSVAPTNFSRNSSSALDTTPRKVVVHNVLKFLNKKELGKIVQSWLDDAAKPDGFRLVIDRYQKPPRNGWISVKLAEDCMVEPFINLINGTERVNKRGQIQVARRVGEEADNRRNDRKKRDRDDNDGPSDNKRARPDVPKCPTPSQIRDKITALWSQPYSAQMETKKRDMIKNCAMKITKEMKAKFRNIEKEAKRNPSRVKTRIFPWVNDKSRGGAIAVENVIRSPLVMRYRNKCELTFGYRYPQDQESEKGALEIETDGRSENDKDMSENQKTEETCSSVDGLLSSSSIVSTKDETQTRIPAVGFLPYGWRHAVARPHCLQNIPHEVCAITDLIDDFLSNSPLLPYDTSVHRGFWRSITIRSSKSTGQVMIIVVHASPEGGAGEEKPTSENFNTSSKEKQDLFERERERLVGILTKDELTIPERDLPLVQIEVEENNDPTKDEEIEMEDKKSKENDDGPFRVTSIYFQEYNGLSNPSVSHPVQHAYGSKFIEEKLGPNTYQISPGAFFQVTTAGAEVLYNVVADRIKEVSSDPAETLMVDVCCGTGTIGLHCLTKGVVGRVVGVDISKPAIEDAMANAKRNGFYVDENKGKTRFVASRAELVMAKELRRANDVEGNNSPPHSIVAVVDPARDGLHPDVIIALRSAKEIQRLVYVSCNPTGSLIKDAVMLCGPATNKYRGLPFKPSRAQPVDMFPLTPHCEMVMTFDRMTEQDVIGGSKNEVSKPSTVKPPEEQETMAKDEKENNGE
mmetsp:Transcript_25114/g.29041  ORF Transcript_25114/g.29041 Transcript_25114/m.29041 type:complete len:773 (-) Transcript_25114:1176-3494(-)